jgi:uncharacterized membrane protein
MSNLIKSAIQAVFILATASVTTSAIAAADHGVIPDNMERCYGIAKAGMNDCGTATQSCAGTIKKDRAPNAYLVLPKGLCQKIAGSSLQPPKE